jgi:hypothetical protein
VFQPTRTKSALGMTVPNQGLFVLVEDRLGPRCRDDLKKWVNVRKLRSGERQTAHLEGSEQCVLAHETSAVD